MTEKSNLMEIVYTKETPVGQEVTERVVIGNSKVGNMKAIDVTDLSEDERNHMLVLYREYQEYVGTVLKTIFPFETWVEHTRNDTIETKWRDI